MSVLGAYLFCHRATEINAGQERAIICICFSLSLTAVAHFAVIRIGDVVERFLLADRGSPTTYARTTKEMKYRDAAENAYFIKTGRPRRDKRMILHIQVSFVHVCTPMPIYRNRRDGAYLFCHRVRDKNIEDV